MIKNYKIKLLTEDEDILFNIFKNVTINYCDEELVDVVADPLDIKIWELQRLIEVVETKNIKIKG